jgi:hypothetical protein
MKQGGRLARLLDVDPDLAEGLEERDRLLARQRLVVPAITLEPGQWDPHATLGRGDDVLGVLIAEGLLLREVVLVQSTCGELLGPGDVIRPWHTGTGESLLSHIEWRVLSTTTMLVLHRKLLTWMAPWPQVTMALTARAVTRAQTLALVLAISCIRGLEVRLLALLWHLADGFGRVGREGVIVPLPLTHEVIGRLAGATRPSVTTALGHLERQRSISKRLGGGFVLHGAPPDLTGLVDVPGTRSAGDRPA